MNKIATSACTSCHKIFPRTKMRLVSSYEKSGSSKGISTNLATKKSTRVSYRSYSRKRERWVCYSCYAIQLDNQRKSKKVGWILSIIGFLIIVGLMDRENPDDEFNPITNPDRFIDTQEVWKDKKN